MEKVGLIFLALVGTLFLGIFLGIKIESKKLNVADSMSIYLAINKEREARKLSPLKLNPAMCPYTEQRTTDLQTDFSHTKFREMINSNIKPYDYIHAGENLEEGYFSTEEIVKNWINSPTHFQNITNGEFTDTCVVYKDGYTVQEFASFTK